MRTQLSNKVHGVLKTFGLLPGADRGLRFDRRVEAMTEDVPDVAVIVRPLLAPGGSFVSKLPSSTRPFSAG